VKIGDPVITLECETVVVFTGAAGAAEESAAAELSQVADIAAALSKKSKHLEDVIAFSLASR
jgi:hypothetical protein